MSAVEVRVRRLPGRDPDLPLPIYATAGAAGMDVCVNLAPGDREAGLRLAPGARALAPTGLALEIPDGFEAQLRPRSGLALRAGLTLLNAPGTIDADYRGEVKVLVINHGTEPVVLAHGMRIAQLVLAPVARLAWREAEDLGASARGARGFGSTGTGGLGSTGTGGLGSTGTGGLGSTGTGGLGSTGTGGLRRDAADLGGAGSGGSGAEGLWREAGEAAPGRDAATREGRRAGARAGVSAPEGIAGLKI